MYYLFFCKAINDASIVKLLGTKIDLKTMLGLYLVVENLENSLFNPVVHWLLGAQLAAVHNLIEGLRLKPPFNLRRDVAKRQMKQI